jgi:PAS domain S-box-containing protein
VSITLKFFWKSIAVFSGLIFFPVSVRAEDVLRSSLLHSAEKDLDFSVILLLISFFSLCISLTLQIRTNRRLKKTRISLARELEEKKSTERKLWELAERYRLVIENPNEAILITQHDTIAFANTRALEMFGFDLNELSTKPFMEFVHPDDREEFSISFMKRLKGEKFQGRYCFRIQRQDGTVLWVGMISIVFLYNGNPASLDFINDITDRRMAAESVKKSERRFSQIFQAAPLPMIISHLSDGRVVDVNRAFLKQCGFLYDNVIGKTVSELNLWGSDELRNDFIEALRKNHSLEGRLIKFRIKSGEIREGIIASEIIEIDGEKCILGMFQDITDFKRTEKALSEKETHIRAMLEAMPDMVLLFSSEGTLIECHISDSKRKFIPLEKMIGKKYQNFLPREIREQFTSAFNNVLDKGALQLIEYSLTRNNKKRHFESRLVPCGNDRLLEIVRDVTEEKRLAEQLVVHERLAAVGDTMARAAHCMKNIFTALKGAIQLHEEAIKTNDRDLSEKSHEIMQRSSSRLYILMMELLDYSKDREAKKSTFNLKELFREVIQMLQLVSPPHTSIEYTVSEKIETVYLDSSWMYRILVNLGRNALDAMPEGGLLRFKAFYSSVPDEKELVIEVSDTGTGITEEYMSRIFEPMFSTKKSGGTGLGLPTVKQFVDAQKGRIDVDTSKGNGTTFRLYFPCEKEEEREITIFDLLGESD